MSSGHWSIKVSSFSAAACTSPHEETRVPHWADLSLSLIQRYVLFWPPSFPGVLLKVLWRIKDTTIKQNPILQHCCLAIISGNLCLTWRKKSVENHFVTFVLLTRPHFWWPVNGPRNALSPVYSSLFLFKPAAVTRLWVKTSPNPCRILAKMTV